MKENGNERVYAYVARQSTVGRIAFIAYLGDCATSACSFSNVAQKTTERNFQLEFECKY